MRENQFRGILGLRSNRDKNKVRESLNFLKRSSVLSKDDDNDDNSINNSKNGDGDVGGRRRDEISTSQVNHVHN